FTLPFVPFFLVSARPSRSKLFPYTTLFRSVNDAPTTSPVTLAAIAEDSGVRVITQAQLLGNASDVESNTLTASALAISSGSGTLVDNGDGTWNYTPALNDDTSVRSEERRVGEGANNGVADA